MTTSNVSDFLEYCTYYTYGRKRKRPLYPETLGRYARGLKLAEKIIGHSIEKVSEEDQLILMEQLRSYKQGTRKVTIEIYQRYVAFMIRRGRFSGQNLIRGNEAEIIGEWEPARIPRIKSPWQMQRFMNKVKTPQIRVLLGLMYYGGLTPEEICMLKPEAITEKGVFVYRRVRHEMQHLPLPTRFLNELIEFAEGKERLFSFTDSKRGREQIKNAFGMAQLEADMYQDMTLNDFRKTAIRHFYDKCYDLELTKRFAGVDRGKRGWLDSLQDESSTYMEAIAKRRKYYGKETNTVESV